MVLCSELKHRCFIHLKEVDMAAMNTTTSAVAGGLDTASMDAMASAGAAATMDAMKNNMLLQATAAIASVGNNAASAIKDAAAGH
jgi:hypothetical protein